MNTGGRPQAARIASLVWLALVLFLSLSSCAPVTRRAVVILCAGDSLTDSEYPRDLERLLRAEGYYAKVLNRGRKGNTSGEYLRYLEGRRASLAEEHPDFVLLQLGTNDVRLDGDLTPTADFGRNMRAIVSVFSGFSTRSGGRPAILLALIPPVPETVGFPFGPASRERIAAEINPLLREIAREEHLVLVDNGSLFAASPELLPGVLPTAEGYRRLARNWRDALAPLLKK